MASLVAGDRSALLLGMSVGPFKTWSSAGRAAGWVVSGVSTGLALEVPLRVAADAWLGPRIEAGLQFGSVSDGPQAGQAALGAVTVVGVRGRFRL